MILKKWKQKMKRKVSASDTEFLPAVLEIVETPPSPLGRMMLWTIAALVVTALLWAIIGNVDEVAVAPGKLIPSGYVKVIQAEDKGVIKQIYVKDGQQVKQGEILLEFNPTFSAADFARLRKELAYYNLEMERLAAERTDQPFAPKPQPDIEVRDMEYQRRLYASRMTEFSSKKASIEQSIRQSDTDIAIARATKDRYQALYEVAVEKESRIAQLVEQNAIAYFVLLDHRSRRMELEQNLFAANASISKAESALLQSREALQTLFAEHNRDVDTKIVDNRRQAQALSEDLKKAEEKDRYTRVTAPIAGRVNQLSVHTIGGVVTAAQPLLMIVPDDAVLEAEAWVANKDIGFISIGQHAEIKIETFNFQKFGTIPAEVVELSPDAVEDKEKGRVYRAVLRLQKDGVIVNGKSTMLHSGMSITAEIKTYQKRIIDFFLDPFKKYQSEGLRER